MRALTLPALAMALLPLLSASGPAHAQPYPAPVDCADSMAALDAAVRSGKAATVTQAVKQAQRDIDCSGEKQQEAARRGAIGLAALARDLPLPARRGALEEALKLSASAPPWPVLQQLGDLVYGAKDYAYAQILFEHALNDIADRQATPIPPPSATITRIHSLAGQARMLASRRVSSPVTRSGGAGGLDFDEVRGTKLKRAPVPVGFVYDQATFTPEGDEDAKFLRAYLQDRGDPPITLVGHTDPRGEDAYNCSLSWRRVEALAQRLKTQGYGGRIAVVGMGKRQPRAAIDADTLTPDEVNQLLRRVEYFKANENPEVANACPRP